MKRSSGFTLIELLVVITIIGILASISIPAISGALDKAKLTKAAANLGGVVKIIAIMQVDEVGGDTNVTSFPGTNAVTLAAWYNSLTNYAGTNDLMKLFSAGDVNVSSWTAAGPNTNAFFVYGVTSESEGDAILMTSRNWQAPTTGNGPALNKTAKPFGDKGAVILKKSSVYGGQVITARQATNAVSSIGIATNVLN